MESAISEEMREQLRGIANIVKRACGEGVGFALFLGPAGGPNFYIASAEREDVVKLLREWLTYVRRSGVPRKEKSEEMDARLALERKCAEIGKTIASKASLVLFLFTYGDGGDMAHFTNIRKFEDDIERWVVSQEVRS
jgi:hypothetical protein